MSPAPRPANSSPSLERLQKVLAAAGIGSRRECETLIEEGRVEVDGQTVTELGVRVDPSQQDVRVDGERIRVGRREYFAFYKPTGVLCTSADPEGRLRVIDLIPSSNRVFTVGRLDRSSEGLIVVTSDGPLAQRLTHPSFGIEKTYEVLVVGHPDWDHLRSLLDGVRLAEGWAKAKHIEIRQKFKENTLIRIVLDEGRNREVRRLLARIGHKVLRLKRIAIGGLWLGNLQPGESRRLTAEEIALLEQAAPANRGSSKKSVRPSTSRPHREGGEVPRVPRPTGTSRSRRDEDFVPPNSRVAARPSRGPARRPPEGFRPGPRPRQSVDDRAAFGRRSPGEFRPQRGDESRPGRPPRRETTGGRSERPSRDPSMSRSQGRPRPDSATGRGSSEGMERGPKPVKRRGRPLAGKVRKKPGTGESVETPRQESRPGRSDRPQVRPTRVPRSGQARREPRAHESREGRPPRPPRQGEGTRVGMRRDRPGRPPRGPGRPESSGFARRPAPPAPPSRGRRTEPPVSGRPPGRPGRTQRPGGQPRPGGRRPFGPADLPEGD